MLILCRCETCMPIISLSKGRPDSFVFVLFYFGYQCWDLYNFKIIEQVSIYWAKIFLDIGSELKVMHFTSIICYMTSQVANTIFKKIKNK